MLCPKFESTHEEYRWLRKQCGYDSDVEFAPAVWNNCTAEAQEMMLEQYRGVVREADRYVSTHGQVW